MSALQLAAKSSIQPLNSGAFSFTACYLLAPPSLSASPIAMSSGSDQSSRVLFADMQPQLAASWLARHGRVPSAFFEQLLEMGFPDWL
jgi:hypothetical protein